MRAHHIVGFVSLAALVSIVSISPAIAQSRGKSGLPPGPGNPFQAIGGGPANAVQGVETNLVVIRGTVAGLGASAGAGFTVAPYLPVHCTNGLDLDPEGGVFIPGYTITFDQPFDSAPSVSLAIHARSDASHIVAIDDDAFPGGVSPTGFSVFFKNATSNTCASQGFGFIAIGPLSTP